ncbi:MAG: Haloacid dehalogenase domain protein hydrolase, partial [Caulobacteraceae bacterium]|nr:Haloacid dehalogenase domain protein hydrolase [Caulobacteraceae bacterium]
MRLTTVGVDADDTLWRHETVFRLTQDRLAELLAPYAERSDLDTHLAEVEAKNLRFYGYGVKAFTLSMIETALAFAGDASGPVIREILAAGREMLTHPIEALPGVEATLVQLGERYRLVVITKGDLLDQERKLAASGLGDLFMAVEIVSEKTQETYARVFARHGTGAAEAAMVGNSLRSDVLPALAAGAFAAHISYALTWAHEAGVAPIGHPRFAELSSFAEIPGWL